MRSAQELDGPRTLQLRMTGRVARVCGEGQARNGRPMHVGRPGSRKHRGQLLETPSGMRRWQQRGAVCAKTGAWTACILSRPRAGICGTWCCVRKDRRVDDLHLVPAPRRHSRHSYVLVDCPVLPLSPVVVLHSSHVRDCCVYVLDVERGHVNILPAPLPTATPEFQSPEPQRWCCRVVRWRDAWWRHTLRQLNAGRNGRPNRLGCGHRCLRRRRWDYPVQATVLQIEEMP